MYRPLNLAHCDMVWMFSAPNLHLRHIEHGKRLKVFELSGLSAATLMPVLAAPMPLFKYPKFLTTGSRSCFGFNYAGIVLERELEN